jgi:uncharacterized sulfatase
MRFTNMFCTGPVCSASRSALMSGRYQNNIGAHNHRTWEWHKQTLPAPARHISEWFRDAGSSPATYSRNAPSASRSTAPAAAAKWI